MFPLPAPGFVVPPRLRPGPGLTGAATVVARLAAFTYACFCTGLVAVVATCVALYPRAGARVLPGGLVLLAAGWSFLDSHLFRPAAS